MSNDVALLWLQAVIAYFRNFPDCSHHPKEDMIFEKLAARSPAAAKSVGDLEAEHRDEAMRLRRVEDMVQSILLDQRSRSSSPIADASAR